MNDAASKLAPTLEQRISQALADAGIASADLAALVQETESAIVAADQAAAKERERAHDPAQSPDPASAYQVMQTAKFAAARLHKLLPRVQARYQEVVAQERLDAWRADYEAVETKRDRLASEFRETYPLVVGKLVDLFQRAAAVDAEVSHINSVAPDGASGRLVGVELAARGMQSFSTFDPSIAKAVQLPDFDHSDRMAWPPPTPSLAAQVAESMASMIRPHPGANWASEREERSRELRAEHERAIAHYAAMARQREEREAAEVRAVQERRAAE
jgi:hypothetical protein